MVATTDIALTAGNWIELSSGQANVLVQSSTGVVKVRVASAPPASNAKGHTLDSRQRYASFGSLGATDKVYAKSAVATYVVVTK